MTVGVVLAIVGVWAIWLSTTWFTYTMGRGLGRAEALEDALGGREWLLRCGPASGTMIEQVARNLATAQMGLGIDDATDASGAPTERTRMLAKTAIAAMRTPTREMTAAVEPFLRPTWHDPLFSFYDIMLEAAADPQPQGPRVLTPIAVDAIRRSLEPLITRKPGEYH